MHPALAYSLGGTALAFTVIATTLDGVCYALFDQSSLESAILSLGVLSCVGLVLLLVLRQRYTQTETWPWRSWQSIAQGLLIVYLLVAAGITAGIIASLTVAPAQALVITRDVTWALSVFLQALFSGLLLFSGTGKEVEEKEDTHRWPRPLSHELETLQNHSSVRNREDRSDSPSTVMGSYRQSPFMTPKMSSDGLAPVHPCVSNVASTRVSSQFSGRTLLHQDSKPSSIDLHAGVTSSNSNNNNNADSSEARVSVGDQGHRTATPQQSDSEGKRSTDSLLILPSPGPPSPAASSTNLGCSATKKPSLPTLNLPPNEKKIHPLFRADSPSPPPTPMPGTMVKASPVAGTTITAKTLSRVRSSNSLRVNNNGRSISPSLLERMSQAEENQSQNENQTESSSAPTAGIMTAGDFRKSLSQYEKKYDLNESPLEG